MIGLLGLFAGWVAVAMTLGFLIFRFTPPPLEARRIVTLFGSISARSFFWAYLLAPHVDFLFVGPASFYLQVHLAQHSSHWTRDEQNCVYSLIIVWTIVIAIYVSRQMLKKKKAEPAASENGDKSPPLS